MPTLTRSVKYFDASNTVHRRHATYTGPASYVTGGDPFTPADFGLGTIVAAHFTAPMTADPESLHIVAYRASSGTAYWFDQNGAQVANGTNLSAVTVEVEVIGY